jgi:hypothetical protein
VDRPEVAEMLIELGIEVGQGDALSTAEPALPGGSAPSSS